MITSNYAENLHTRGKLTTIQKEARKARARQQVEASINDPNVRTAFMAMIGAAKSLHTAGRYRDVRTLLLTVMEMTLRVHFQIVCGRPEAGDIGAAKYADRLRSTGCLDKHTYHTLVELCRQPAPYDHNFSQRLLSVARKLCQITYSTPEEAAAVRLS